MLLTKETHKGLSYGQTNTFQSLSHIPFSKQQEIGSINSSVDLGFIITETKVKGPHKLKALPGGNKGI